jgi:hypothetical protein
VAREQLAQAEEAYRYLETRWKESQEALKRSEGQEPPEVEARVAELQDARFEPTSETEFASETEPTSELDPSGCRSRRAAGSSSSSRSASRPPNSGPGRRMALPNSAPRRARCGHGSSAPPLARTRSFLGWLKRPGVTRRARPPCRRSVAPGRPRPPTGAAGAPSRSVKRSRGGANTTAPARLAGTTRRSLGRCRASPTARSRNDTRAPVAGDSRTELGTRAHARSRDPTAPRVPGPTGIGPA